MAENTNSIPTPQPDSEAGTSADEAAPPGSQGPMPAASAPAEAPRGERFARAGRPGGREFRPRRKVCAFCADKTKEIDYKDVGRLRRFLSDRGKIEPRRKTGTCAKHQRRLAVALKRARFMALLPYTGEHIRETEHSAA